jgi:hypothetical protein
MSCNGVFQTFAKDELLTPLGSGWAIVESTSSWMVITPNNFLKKMSF